MHFENNNLRRIRIRKQMSQKDISSFLGVTQSQYSRIEKGQTSPDKHIEKLVMIFNCKEDDIFPKTREDFFLKDQKILEFIYHKKKLDSVYLKIDGWFTKDEIKKNFQYIVDGMKINIEEDYDDF